MTRPAKPFATVRTDLALEQARCQTILTRAAPPEAMSAAPVAPARGPQALVAEFTVSKGGIRQHLGGHWQALSPIAAMVATARLRHEAKDTEAAFVPPFNPAQVQVAEDYAALVEWRQGSPMKCASVEPGRGGANGNPFIDSYIRNGIWLAELHRRIGTDVALSPRRHMDRGNGRGVVTVRVAVDMLCLGGKDLTGILQAYGWQANGLNRKALRHAICGALDRMQGYSDGSPQNSA
jgi:hypothetical protein